LDLKQPPSETNGRQRRNFVSLLQAKDCPTLKHMMKLMIERTLENTEDKADNQLEKEEGEEDEDDDDIIRTVQVSTIQEIHTSD
jgi:origin recognition complex subunit 3